MNPYSTEATEAIRDFVNDHRIAQIVKKWASRCNIDWEDLRQTVAIQLLTRYSDPATWRQRIDVVCTEIRSCAIDLYRREPIGKLRRIGERSRRTFATGVSSNKLDSPMSPTVRPLDATEISAPRSSMEDVISRIDVEDTISCLPAMSRPVAEMRLLKGLTFPEIAVHTGHELEQIKSRWRSDIATLRPLVEKGWL